MNNNDDFGQYNCITENIHGRNEASFLIFASEQLAIVSTLTTKKFHRHSKYPILKFDSNKKYLRLTTTNVYIERDIHISSSSYRLWTFHKLKNLLFLLLLLLFQLKRIDR
jgi:hypothetical protein